MIRRPVRPTENTSLGSMTLANSSRNSVCLISEFMGKATPCFLEMMRFCQIGRKVTSLTLGSVCWILFVVCVVVVVFDLVIITGFLENVFVLLRATSAKLPFSFVDISTLSGE